MKVTWLCWIFWLMSSLGVGCVVVEGGVTAATAASRGESCRGSRLWVSSPVPQMALSDWGRKIHSTSLVFCPSLSLPIHNIWHSHRIIQLSHPHWFLSSNTLHWRVFDSSYIKPAMNKNKPAKKKNVHGHSCYTHILRSQLQDKCWGYEL